MSLGRAGPGAAGVPSYCLAHQREEEVRSYFSRETVVRRYDLWPIPVPRPVRGRATAAVACGTCGRSFSCTVSSLVRVRRRRRAAVIALIAAAAGYLAAFLLLVTLGVVPWDRFVGVAGFVAGPVLIVTVIGILAGEPDAGIRLAGDSCHTVRPSGSTESVQARSDPYVSGEY
jgi:hypothetical protein